jgi:hypothetical protein
VYSFSPFHAILSSAGELEPCPEAEIVFGAHRACAMYASEQSHFALAIAETINAPVVVAVPADGCEPIWENAEAVNGSIAVVDRGACPFADKAAHAQAAGAVAVVVANNQPGAVFAMAGNFSSVTIPAVLITLEDGTTLKDSAAAMPTATLNIGAPPSLALPPSRPRPPPPPPSPQRMRTDARAHPRTLSHPSTHAPTSHEPFIPTCTHLH